MRKSIRLRLISLERRDLPAQFGVPWTDHHVSMSFAPDGTSVDGVGSNLYQFFGGTGSVWKDEVLRAAQTWAANADLAVSVVADDGLAAGTPGIQQHDPRFGDIRVFGRPLASDVLAMTVPPGPAGGTRAGDIIINTAQPISIGGGDGKFDLYSCMLQETGHAFGLSNDANIDSPMYEWYQGVRTGIVALDVTHITALYGLRLEDVYDATADNGAFADATCVSAATVLPAGADSQARVNADLTSDSDADYYWFTVPQNANGTISIQLQTSGESLLQGRLAIFTANHSMVWESSADSPLAGDLTAVIANIQPGQTYYARVDRALGTNPFGQGQYQLHIDFNPTGPEAPATIDDSVVDDAHTNDSAATATVLTATRSGVYGIDARFADAKDVDVYKITVPADSAPLLTVSIRSATSGMTPLLSVVNSSLAPVPFQVVHNFGGCYALQASVTPGQDVYLVAAADSNGTTTIGDYRLDANLNTGATPLTELASGTLTQAQPIIVESLVVNVASVMHFALTESTANPSNNFGAQVEVVDSSGNVDMKFGAASYTSVTAAKYLAPGTYTVRIGGKVRTAGATLPDLAVSLKVFNLSDPIGPRPDNPDVPDDYWRGQRPVTWSPWDIDLDIIF
jgi:hypothetical protein